MPVPEKQPEWLQSVFQRKLVEKRRLEEDRSFQARIIEKSQLLYERISELWYSTQNGGFERTLPNQNGEVEIQIKITINDDASISMFVDTESVTVWPANQNRMPRLIITDRENHQLVEKEFDFDRIDQTVQLLDHLQSL